MSTAMRKLIHEVQYFRGYEDSYCGLMVCDTMQLGRGYHCCMGTTCLHFQTRLVLLILVLSFQTAWYCMTQNIWLRTYLSVFQRVAEIEGSLLYKLSFWECSFEDYVAVDENYVLWLNGQWVYVQGEETRESNEENAPVAATNVFGFIFRWPVMSCVLWTFLEH